MATIFTTLFRNADSDEGSDYQSFYLTLRALFDYSVGNFTPMEMGNYDTSYGIMYIVHTVISNIFLMNYLIAIL